MVECDHPDASAVLADELKFTSKEEVMNRLALSCALTGGIIIMASAIPVSAQQTKSSSSSNVSLRSAYLVEAVGGAHTIAVEGELGGRGQVTLDGNACTLNQFGDPGICTEAYYAPIDVKLTLLRLADPSGQGRRIFRLEGDLQPKGSAFFLVAPRRPSSIHRLVVDLGNDKRRVVTLEKFERPDDNPQTAKPELCHSASYRAEQVDGKVNLYATGSHPTGGWKTSFEQLPIRIYPPQYRLVCVKPTGIVTQVISPFEVNASFTANNPVPHVIVHDAQGQHRVPVVAKSSAIPCPKQ